MKPESSQRTESSYSKHFKTNTQYHCQHGGPFYDDLRPIKCNRSSKSDRPQQDLNRFFQGSEHQTERPRERIENKSPHRLHG